MTQLLMQLSVQFSSNLQKLSHFALFLDFIVFLQICSTHDGSEADLFLALLLLFFL